MRMRKCLTCVVAVLFLAAVTAPSAMAAREEEESLARIIELKRDISILNLLNGLHLTAEQQSDLLEEARNAEALRDQYRRRCANVIPRTEQKFEELKSQLMNLKTRPPKDVEDHAKKADKEVKKIHEAFVRDFARIEQRASDILTDGQKKIVEDFKPCIIPPRNLRDPSRAGQAKDSSQIERLLSRSRMMPDHKFDRRINARLDKHISKLDKYYGPMTDEEIDFERKRVLAVVEEARSMSDVDFELNKQELAERVDPHEYYDQSAERPHRKHRNRTGKIARFLLSERIIPLLEQRSERAELSSYTGATSLSSITPAENCRQACSSE